MAPFFKSLRVESHMRESRIKKTKTVCTYCGVGCSFDVWTKDRHILKVEPLEGAANGVSTCIKGKFGWGHINSPDRLTKPLIREGDGFREASWDEAHCLWWRADLQRSRRLPVPTRWPSSLLRSAPMKKAT
jgi:formate dehydrogenase major subunit